MKWNGNQEEDKRIVDKTDWFLIDNYKELKENAGVYVFVNDDLDVKYIGRAGQGRMVLEHIHIFEIHSAICRGKDNGATKVKALYTQNNKLSIALEADLIKIYTPSNNIYLKD